MQQVVIKFCLYLYTRTHLSNRIQTYPSFHLHPSILPSTYFSVFKRLPICIYLKITNWTPEKPQQYIVSVEDC